MKTSWVQACCFFTSLVLVAGLSGCLGSGESAKEAVYGKAKPGAPSGASCTPETCSGESEGKDKCVLTPVGATCECNDFYTEDGDGCVYAGERTAARSPGSGLDQSTENPSYTAVLVVLGTDNKPIPETTVQIGNLVYSPNSDDEFRIADVALNEEVLALVKAPKYAPITKRVSWMNAGQVRMVLRPLPIESTLSFDADVGLAVDLENAAVQVTGDSFIKNVLKDGYLYPETYNGDITLETASLDPETDNMDAAPGGMLGVNRGSEQVGVSPAGMVNVTARDDEGNELVIREGRSVSINYQLPANFAGEEGASVPMWYFDEASNRWKEEGSCTVQAVTSGERLERRPDRTLECVGEVKHFSWWSPSWSQMFTNCSNHSVQVDVPPGYVIYDVMLMANSATLDVGPGMVFPIYDINMRYIFPMAPADPFSYCLEYSKTFYAQQFDTSAVAAPTSLTVFVELLRMSDWSRHEFVHVEQVDPTNFPGDVFYAAWYPYSQAAMLCGNESQCLQQTIVVPSSTFIGLDGHLNAAFADNDGDGFYTGLSNSTGGAEVPLDCDDSNPDVNPDAVELPCDNIDNDCDGVAFSTETGSHEVGYVYGDMDAESWNRWCSLECFQPEDADVAGNDHDEDCNGVVGDNDSDGFTVEEGDCNDNSGQVYPTRDGNETEEAGIARDVRGNDLDENCDGEVADADGDGWLSSTYCQNVAGGGTWWEECRDCDDRDPSVSPDSTRSESMLAQGITQVDPATGESVNIPFYRCDEEDAEGACTKYYRTEEFCQYFGSLEAIEHNSDLLIKDYNCDGVASDLDGDGYTAYGDNSKGIEYAWDCDDLDPRIRPDGPSFSDPPDCGWVEELNAGNASECEADLTNIFFKDGDESAESGAICAQMPDSYQPACVDLNDSEGAFSGRFVCSPGPKAIHTRPPNPYGFTKGADGKVYAQAWAPCDGKNGEGALPGCDKSPDCEDILDVDGSPTGEIKCGPPLICIQGFKFDIGYLEDLRDWGQAGHDLDDDGANDLPLEMGGELTDFMGRTLRAGSFDITDTENHSLCAPICGDLCTKNPCMEPNKGACALSTSPPPEAICSCSQGYHDDDAGACVAD